MNSGRMIVGIALAAALASTGCATKARVTTAKACAAHGGTYNASARTCSYTASTRSAKQICDQQGGYYDTVADVGETGMDEESLLGGLAATPPGLRPLAARHPARLVALSHRADRPRF